MHQTVEMAPLQQKHSIDHCEYAYIGPAQRKADAICMTWWKTGKQAFSLPHSIL
jgi:hypothetical protein